MRKLVLGVLLGALALTGCGGSSHSTSSAAVSAPVTTNTRTVPTMTSTAQTTPTTTSTAHTKPTTTTSASTASTSSSSSTPSGGSGIAPGQTTSRSTTSTTATSTGHTYTPKQVAEAKAALPGCRREQPSITLQQLEQEAASPEGIQC